VRRIGGLLSSGWKGKPDLAEGVLDKPRIKSLTSIARKAKEKAWSLEETHLDISALDSAGLDDAGGAALCSYCRHPLTKGDSVKSPATVSIGFWGYPLPKEGDE
jgi:hypothetical protein